VEDLWLAITCQRHLQGIETELRVKAVGELPAEHVSAEQIHDRHQVEKSLLQRDVGDVGRPDLIHSRDQPEVHQTGKPFRRVSWNRGSWLLIDRPQTHAAHKVSYPIAADRYPFSGQIVHHPAATAAWILQVERIDPGHDPQRRVPHRYRPVIERRSGQTQQRALPADAELRVVVIDQLAQFTGIRAAEIFFEPLQLHLQLAVAVRLLRSSTAGTAQPP
jgi:hypothetical protein